MKNFEEITTEETSAGFKIYRSEKHIKTIPAKFAFLIDIVDLDESKKRLNDEDRSKLEVAYFMHILKSQEPYVYELVRNSFPKYAQEVNNHGIIRYELVFENNTRIKVTQPIYESFPEKMDMKYSNY